MKSSDVVVFLIILFAVIIMIFINCGLFQNMTQYTIESKNGIITIDDDNYPYINS